MGFVVQNKHDKMSLRIFNQNSLLFRPFPPHLPQTQSTEKSRLKCCLQIGRDTRLPYSHPRP